MGYFTSGYGLKGLQGRLNHFALVGNREEYVHWPDILD